MANNFKSTGVSGISTASGSPTVIYTANNGAAINSVVLQIDVANTGTERSFVSILLADADGGTYHIIKDGQVPVGGTLQIIAGQKIVLNGDDQLQIYGSTATNDCVVSFLEDVA
jgi:hypothetical protein